ncbi:MAG: ATP-binding protein [Thermodesulfovibrio sp.]|nr:ATP-binding protein [Thermodesulfovibrio sp.]MDW7972952.1 ATP-binding protein [Thermodesulfovibrio sp.]
MIFADKDDIVKIVLNLVLNSQDAMPNGGELRIELKKSLPEGFKVFIEQKILKDYACLTITDTGIGMDEETKAKIFEPFFTTKGEKGSGLGLPTVYYIVQMLNGYIFLTAKLVRAQSLIFTFH